MWGKNCRLMVYLSHQRGEAGRQHVRIRNPEGTVLKNKLFSPHFEKQNSDTENSQKHLMGNLFTSLLKQ